MDAPLYPPAASYVAPVHVARALDTSQTSIAELQANPAAWAIVTREVPGAQMMVNVPMLKPHLGNFSLRSLVDFGAVKVDGLDRADIALKALGPQL